MKVLTKIEAENWLPLTGIEFDLRGDLGFRSGKNLVITVPLPDKPYRLSYLSSLLVTGSHDSAFGDSLLWFMHWGAGHEVSNRVGFKLLRAMHTDSRPFIEAPARLFDQDEMVEAQSLFVLAILMGWDAYFIPAAGKYFVFNSNDEYIDVISSDDETHARFLELLKDRWGGKEW